MIRKREPRWQSAADRARVAAELLEEAESLSENSTIATPAEVARASLPPPIRAQLPDAAPPTAPEGGAGGAPAGTDAPATAAPGLDELVAREPDNVGLLLQRAEVLCSRAPRTTNDSLDIDSEPTRVLASRSTLPNLLLNPRRFPTLALPPWLRPRCSC